MGDEGVHQRAALIARRGVDDEAGRLVEHDQVGVLVQDHERYGLGQRDRWLHGRRLDREGVPGMDRVRRVAHRGAAQLDRSRLDQGLDA